MKGCRGSMAKEPNDSNMTQAEDDVWCALPISEESGQALGSDNVPEKKTPVKWSNEGSLRLLKEEQGRRLAKVAPQRTPGVERTLRTGDDFNRSLSRSNACDDELHEFTGKTRS